MKVANGGIDGRIRCLVSFTSPPVMDAVGDVLVIKSSLRPVEKAQKPALDIYSIYIYIIELYCHLLVRML